MTIDFTCPGCGRLIRTDGPSRLKVRCPACRARVSVPGALAELARPNPAAEGAAPAPAEEAAPEGPVRFIAIAMPWTFSVLFHVGIALVMMLLTMIVAEPPRKSPPLISTAPVPPKEAVRTERPRREARRQASGRPAGPEAPRPAAPHAPRTAISTPDTATRSGLLIGGDSSGHDGTGWSEDSDGPPTFIPISQTPIRADDIVFVLDRSGSMAAGDAFGLLTYKLAESIGALAASDGGQRFHLIFFGSGEPLEMKPARLTEPDEDALRRFDAFLKTVHAEGSTKVLPALKRAFKALGKARPDREKVIYLLSDGAFDAATGPESTYKGRTGNKAVLQWLKDANDGPDGRRVTIHTCLYRGDDPAAAALMKRIAAEHGGSFAHVTKDE